MTEMLDPFRTLSFETSHRSDPDGDIANKPKIAGANPGIPTYPLQV